MLDLNPSMQFFYFLVDVNECKENKTLCSNEVENCVNTLGSYMCVCVTGYSMSANGTCEGNIYIYILYVHTYTHTHTHSHIYIAC